MVETQYELADRDSMINNLGEEVLGTMGRATDLSVVALLLELAHESNYLKSGVIERPTKAPNSATAHGAGQNNPSRSLNTEKRILARSNRKAIALMRADKDPQSWTCGDLFND